MNVGVVLAALLFMRRMAESVTVQQEVFGGTDSASDSGEALPEALPSSVLVYRIDGPFFFGAAEKLEATVERAQLHVETVIIRLGRVPFMDATGMHTFREILERFRRRGIRVALVEMQPRLVRMLERADLMKLVGPHNVFDDLSAALQAVSPRR